MPETVIKLYCEDGKSPVYDWLRELETLNPTAYEHGLDRLRLLKEFGFNLRRPAVDSVGDGLYELRWKEGRVQYRIIYFYHGRNVAILSHGMTKEKRLDPRDISRALKRKMKFEQNPDTHVLDWNF